MSADLYLHVFEDGVLTEEDFKAFFYSTYGSKWYDPSLELEWVGYRDNIFKKFSNTQNIWIGEVSWFKAALFEDSDNFIPDLVNKVSEFVGEELPVVDDEFIKKIESFYSLENKTRYNLSEKKEVIEFLEQNKGKRAFTVSW